MLIAAAALAGCTGKKTADVQQETRVLTKTETAESATVQLTEEFTSEIEPFRENDITPAASGVHIDRILVEVGDPVHEGQLIVTLDPTQYTQQLVQLKTVEDDYNRLLPVYEAGGISAQQIQQVFQNLGIHPVIAVHHLKENACGIFKSCVHRFPMPAVFLVDGTADSGIFPGITVSNLSCPVFGGSVIHNDDFHFLPARKQGVDTVLHIAFRVIAGDCHSQ